MVIILTLMSFTCNFRLVTSVSFWNIYIPLLLMFFSKSSAIGLSMLLSICSQEEYFNPVYILLSELDNIITPQLFPI